MSRSCELLIMKVYENETTQDDQASFSTLVRYVSAELR